MKLLIDRPEQPVAAMLLAHGAGAPMDSEFMNALTAALNRQQLLVLRFEFPYMAERRTVEGKKRPPDRQPLLIATWEQAYLAARQELGETLPLLIGGKSLGGRMATVIADHLNVAGVCCYGYPFYPPGRPDKPRTAHLEALQTPTLILQGSRDPFGGREQVAKMKLSGRIQVHWLRDGDHDFKPRKRSGLTQADLIEEASLRTAYFVRG